MTSLEVVDAEGSRQIISLTESLLLEEDVPREIVVDARAKLSELVENLKTERDELRVRSHLLTAELEPAEIACEHERQERKDPYT